MSDKPSEGGEAGREGQIKSAVKASRPVVRFLRDKIIRSLSLSLSLFEVSKRGGDLAIEMASSPIIFLQRGRQRVMAPSNQLAWGGGYSQGQRRPIVGSPLLFLLKRNYLIFLRCN